MRAIQHIQNAAMCSLFLGFSSQQAFRASNQMKSLEIVSQGKSITLNATPQIADQPTSAWTFSAGEISAALTKEHGAGKVTIIGEGVGDRLRLWAEGGSLTLPNSKIIMHYATGLHDYSKPCWRDNGCFWTMYFFPMHLNTLEPDVAIPYTFADYRALRDPVVDYILHASSDKGPT